MNRRQLIWATGGFLTVLSGCSGEGTTQAASIRTRTSPTDETPNSGKTSESPDGQTGDDGSSFSVTSPTVEQGETARIQIEATNIEWMAFTDVPVERDSSGDNEYLAVKFEDTDFSPPPDVILDSWPPMWEWSPARNLRAEVPAETYADTQPGTYRLAVTVYKHTAEERGTKVINLSVENTSEG